MKKNLIIVNCLLGLGSVYCLFCYLYCFINRMKYYTTLYTIFNSTNELCLLILMLILQFLVNIFIVLFYKTKKK